MSYDRDNLDPHRCVASVHADTGAFSRSFQCDNARKHGDFCGIHSPEKIAARKAKRGPTQWERDCARRDARNTRERALEGVLLAARRLVQIAVVTPPGEMKRLADAIAHYNEVTRES